LSLNTNLNIWGNPALVARSNKLPGLRLKGCRAFKGNTVMLTLKSPELDLKEIVAIISESIILDHPFSLSFLSSPSILKGYVSLFQRDFQLPKSIGALRPLIAFTK